MKNGERKVKAIVSCKLGRDFILFKRGVRKVTWNDLTRKEQIDIFGGMDRVCKLFGCLIKPIDGEKPLPCPFCGSGCISESKRGIGHRVFCERGLYQAPCGYASPWKNTKYEAIAAHNRVAKAVMESKEEQ